MIRYCFAATALLFIFAIEVRAQAPCCGITAIDARSALATAKVNATGQAFQFRCTAPMRVGEGVYANFKTRQVSLDGKTVCGTIVAVGPVPPSKAPIEQKTMPSQPSGVPTTQAVPGSAGKPSPPIGRVPTGKIQPIELPKLTFGTPQPVKAPPFQGGKAITLAARPYLRFASVGGETLVHLHGLDGIRKATGLPQGVQDFLFLHARKLPPNEVDNYIVNVRLAQEWFKTHPEPDFVKQSAAQAMGSGCSSSEGCNAISIHCAEKAAEHAQCEAGRQEERIRKAWQDEWDHISGQVEHEWNQAVGCLADQTLNPANGAFQFSLTPQFPVSFTKSGSTTNAYGKFSGQVTGTATFGVPVNGSFNGQLQVVYIPCLPFMIRPKSLSGDGTLGVGATLDATLTASGQFVQDVTVPPNGIQIPVYVIPVVIGGIPIAELDTSVYLDGTVHVDGMGTLNGAVSLKAYEETAYNFSCNGGGCDAAAHRVSRPDTASESVQVQGRIHMRPAIYAALQLDLDMDLLSARAGPEPYLLGEVYGCQFASASQSTAGPSTSQQFNALTADVDWGIDLRAEALSGDHKLGEKHLSIYKQTHLLFKDLAHSTALVPGVAGATQTTLGQPAAYKVKMPACYPYSDQIEYLVQWSGGASEAGLGPAPGGSPSNSSVQLPTAVVAVGRVQAAAPPANCTVQPGQADCLADPLKDMPFSLTWPAAGNYGLTITPLRDQHGRKFDASSASQTNVTVQ